MFWFFVWFVGCLFSFFLLFSIYTVPFLLVTEVGDQPSLGQEVLEEKKESFLAFTLLSVNAHSIQKFTSLVYITYVHHISSFESLFSFLALIWFFNTPTPKHSDKYRITWYCLAFPNTFYIIYTSCFPLLFVLFIFPPKNQLSLSCKLLFPLSTPTFSLQHKFQHLFYPLQYFSYPRLCSHLMIWS